MSSMRSSITFSLNSKMNFKVIIVGDKDVGKTSLIIRYVKGTFDKNYVVTIGVQFYSKIVRVKSEQVALQIWDTAGQQSFKSIVKSFYHLASCVVIAYCNPHQLRNYVESYLLEINEFASSQVRVMIVRTKIDQIPFTQEERLTLLEIKEKNNIKLAVQLSSKDDTNVNEFFQQLTEILYDSYKNDEEFKEMVDPKKNSFALNEEENAKKPAFHQKKKCC